MGPVHCVKVVARATGIKQLSGDVNKFKQALKKCLLAGSFYSIEEFLNWSTSSDLNAMYL
jgi:hypothetical protein